MLRIQGQHDFNPGIGGTDIYAVRPCRVPPVVSPCVAVKVPFFKSISPTDMGFNRKLLQITMIRNFENPFFSDQGVCFLNHCSRSFLVCFSAQCSEQFFQIHCKSSCRLFAYTCPRRLYTAAPVITVLSRMCLMSEYSSVSFSMSASAAFSRKSLFFRRMSLAFSI